ncbi:hypothetical protein BGZ92_006849, partial [Podila epicladia]
ESYRHFSARILRTAKQHRIEDNNKLILTMLQQQIPYRDLDMVNLQFISQRNQTMPDALDRTLQRPSKTSVSRSASSPAQKTPGATLTSPSPNRSTPNVARTTINGDQKPTTISNCRKLVRDQDNDRPTHQPRPDRSDRPHDRYQPYNRNDDRYRPKDTRNARGRPN